MRRTTSVCALILLSCLSVHAQTKPDSGAQKPAAEPQSKPPTQEQTQALNLSAYVELLRSDIRTQKVAIITEVMGFTEAEDAAFWPLYREYDVEMAKLGDERARLIQDYTNNYAQLNDAAADKTATAALDLQARRHAVQVKYYERVKKALSPKTAMRFLQVEQQLLMLIDLQIASLLPIVQ
jgi:hypothetical protein